jgi:hypothetical protein
MVTMSHEVPRFSSPDQARRTRALFSQHGFDEPGIAAAAGEKTLAAVERA